MIPVDEPHTGAVVCGRHERVRSPQVAVQERVRSPRFLQDLCPPGSVRERGVQPIEQTIAYRHRLYRRLEGTPGQRFEAPDGVGDVRHEKGQAQVLAVVADLRQQRVLSGTRVQLGHESDSRLDARTIRASVEGLVAEILIDLPHTATLPLRHRGQQGGTAVAQPDGREPAFGDQSVELRDSRLAALEDQGAWSGPRLELQPVYAMIEPCQADRWHSGLGAPQERLQGFEQLGGTGLAAAFQRVAKLCGVIDGRVHIATLDGPHARPGPARAHAPRRDGHRSIPRPARAPDGSGARSRTPPGPARAPPRPGSGTGRDRKSTRLNSSHGYISYAVFCLKKKNIAATDSVVTFLGIYFVRVAGISLATVGGAFILERLRRGEAAPVFSADGARMRPTDTNA